jgi:O-antigen/teichoic acid export membrane protein
MKVKLSPGSYQTVMYGSGIVIMKLVSLIMIPYVTRFLSPLEFGTLEIVLTFFSLSSIVFGFGLAEAMFRYAGLTTSASEQAKICAATTGLTLLLSLILGAVFFFLAPLFINLLPGNINNFQMNLMIFTIMLDSLIGVQLSWLRLKNQVKTFLWLSCTRALLQALFVVIFLALGYSVTGVIIAGAL